MQKQKLEYWPIEKFSPYDRNPRRNDHAVNDMAHAIINFGFRIPIIAKSDSTVIDGHLRLKAATLAGLKELPVLVADDMSEDKIKAFRINVNKMAELATWDSGLLKQEIFELDESEFDLKSLGFNDRELASLLPDDDDIDVSDENEDDEGTSKGVEQKLTIIISCENQEEHENLFDELNSRGFKVKV